MSRKFFFLITFFIFLIVFIASTIAAEPNLAGYWPFDEGSGKETKDASGNGNHGKFVGNPEWVNGKYGKALRFDGTSSYVVVEDANSISMDADVTYAAWFQPDVTINAGNNVYRMLSKNNDYFLLFNYEKLGQLGWLIKEPGGTNHVIHSTTAEWLKGEWYHVTGTFDGKEMKIYINGIMEGKLAYSGKVGTSKLALWIGADDFPNYFSGVIDEVRIYNKVLDDTAIKKMMEAGASVDSSGKTAVTWGKIKGI